MISNIYTTLLDLIRQNNTELLSIISRRLKSSDDDLQLTKLLEVEQTSAEEAMGKIHNVLDIISGNGDFFGKYIAIENILQQGGVAKLMYLLYKKGKENDDEWIVNEFLSPIEKIQSLFRGMPLFKVEVVDARPNKEKKVGTRMNNMGAHGGCGGLAMGTCHTKSLVCMCQPAEHLGTFLHGKAMLTEIHQFMMFSWYCRGIDHQRGLGIATCAGYIIYIVLVMQQHALPLQLGSQG